MRILAIAFAVSSLVACVDQTTPVGVDDIEENTDDGFGPDTFKGDVDNPTVDRPVPGADHTPTNKVGNELLPTAGTISGTKAVKKDIGVSEVTLNPVPVR
jgi:hypothetical protein